MADTTPRVIVVERNQRETRGLLLYLHNYPHAVHEDGRVSHFQQRPQRVALLTDDGKTWHFTVPVEVRNEF